MITFLRKRRLRWYGHVLRKEGEETIKKMLNMQVQGKRRRGGYHQEDVKHAGAGKEKAQEKMASKNQGGHVWHRMTEDMAQNQSVRHMKTMAGSLVQGIWVSRQHSVSRDNRLCRDCQLGFQNRKNNLKN